MTQVIPDPAVEPTISVARAAKILGIGTRSAYDAVHRDEWPVLKVGGTYRIYTAQFLRKFSGFIDKNDAA